MKNESKAMKDEKMIKIQINFHTNLSRSSTIIPKRGLTNGTVALRSNKSHGIVANQKNFNSLSEILVKIEELLIEGGITLSTENGNMRKYIKSEIRNA